MIGQNPQPSPPSTFTRRQFWWIERKAEGSQTLPYGENTRHFKKCRLLNRSNREGTNAKAREKYAGEHVVHQIAFYRVSITIKV